MFETVERENPPSRQITGLSGLVSVVQMGPLEAVWWSQSAPVFRVETPLGPPALLGFSPFLTRLGLRPLTPDPTTRGLVSPGKEASERSGWRIMTAVKDLNSESPGLPLL